MGCLCPRIFAEKNKREIKEKLNDDDEEAPVPISVPTVEDLEANIKTIGCSKYKDLPMKRKLAEYLLKNDLNIFKRHLEEVMNLEDEEFFQLFEGNTEYNYNTQNIKGFRQLAQKFEDNKDLTLEYYDKEEYYEYVLEIWKPNILQNLKSAKDEKEQNNILRQKKINRSKWDVEFRKNFQTIISIKPIKTLGERMKNYIQDYYEDFDKLINCLDTCKEKVEKEPNTLCNQVLKSNLETSKQQIINEMVPDFMKNLTNIFSGMGADFRNQEEKKAIQTILDKGLSKEEEKKLIDEVKQIYEEEKKSEKNKANGEEKKEEEKEEKKEEKNDLFAAFEYNSEYEKLQEISKKFNDSNTYDYVNEEEEEVEEDEGLHFQELNLADKAKTVFSNKKVKQALLGISLSNVSYSIMHLTKTFMNFKNQSFEIKARLDEIKRKFVEHQSEVRYIDETDIDKSIEQIIECGKKFQSDLLEVEKLISDIKKTIQDCEKEQGQTKMNIVKSCLGFATSLAGACFTEGSDRNEHITTGVINLVSGIGSGIDLAKGKQAIEEFQKYLGEALNLKKQIIDEIDKLRNKYNEMSIRHFS